MCHIISVVFYEIIMFFISIGLSLCDFEILRMWSDIFDDSFMKN